jgi:hypothetical protein
MPAVRSPGRRDRRDDAAADRSSRKPAVELSREPQAPARPAARPDDVLGGLLARAVETWRDAVRLMPGHAILQRVSNEQIEAEARRLWKRKGSLAQTGEEQDADWQLATKNANEIEAEAKRLYEQKGVGEQATVDQQRDWAAAVHTIRQRRLAEEEYASPQRRRTQTAHKDWLNAGAKLAIEELWEHCDPDLRLPGEDDLAAAARAAAAKVALKLTPDYQSPMVDALLAHEHGQRPRPFVSAASEDPHGGHTGTKHIRVGSENDERRRQANRVITHGAYVGGPCPGRAGAFEDMAAADDAIAAALQMLWRRDGGWGAPGGCRDRFARGRPFQGTFTVPAPIRGLVQVKDPWDNTYYPIAERPVYLDDPNAVGGRPLFPDDPLYGPDMIPPRKEPKKDLVTWDARPLTVNAAPAEMQIRVFANAAAPGGWYVNSAWPQ